MQGWLSSGPILMRSSSRHMKKYSHGVAPRGYTGSRVMPLLDSGERAGRGSFPHAGCPVGKAPLSRLYRLPSAEALRFVSVSSCYRACRWQWQEKDVRLE